MKTSRKISIWAVAIAVFLAVGGVYYVQAQQFEDSNIVIVQTQSTSTNPTNPPNPTSTSPIGNNTPYTLYCSPLKSSQIFVSWSGNVSRPHTLTIFNNADTPNGDIDRSVRTINPGASGSFVDDFSSGSPAPGTAISYLVKTTYTDDGTSVNSPSATCDIPSSVLGVDVPTNFSVFARDASTLVLNWKDNVTTDRTYRFDIQRIKANPLVSTNFGITDRQAGSVSFKWSNATAYSPYNFFLERSTSTDPNARFSKTDVSSTSIPNNSFNPPASLNPSPNDFTYTDYSVSEAATYYYRLKACSILPVDGFYMKTGTGVNLNLNKPSLACSDYAGSGAVLATTTQPIAPSNLTATVNSANPTSEIDLAWQDNSNKEEGFYVYRDGASTPIATLGPHTGTGAMSYSDSHLSGGSSHTYIVSSFITDSLNGMKLLSDASNSGSATTQATLTISSTPSAGGSVSGNGINCGSACSVNLNKNTSVSLTVTPAAGYTFLKWTGDVCNNPAGSSNDYVASPTCAFTISADTSVTANFTAVSNPSLPAIQNFQAGDVNMDHVINCSDVSMIVNAIAGTITLTPQQTLLADVNGDGRITSADAMKLTVDNNLGNCQQAIQATPIDKADSTNHWYASIYGGANGWLARQGGQLKFIGNNIWRGLISLLGTGRQFITENLFGVKVGLGQTQSVNYDDYFNLNPISVTAPFYLDKGLDPNSIYLYRIRVTYTDGKTPGTSLWSDILAGETLTTAGGATSYQAYVCTSNSFCDRTINVNRSANCSVSGDCPEQQCNVNADCANVGRSSKTFQEQ